MERYQHLYGEWQDFKRQQPFAWLQFFNNQYGTVILPDGRRSNAAMFITLHEFVYSNLQNLTPIQTDKYASEMERKLDLFIRWLRRTPRRGHASGKENEPPANIQQGGALSDDDLQNQFLQLYQRTYALESTPWFMQNMQQHMNQWQEYQRWGEDTDLLIAQPRRSVQRAIRFLSNINATYNQDLRHRHARRRAEEANVLQDITNRGFGIMYRRSGYQL